MSELPTESGNSKFRVRRLALWMGPLAGAAACWALSQGQPTLTVEGRLVVGVAVWMAIWWITEAVALEATALLPLVLFPALGVMPIKAAAAPYADPTIFFFMGGMMLGAAMERWGLPRRFALHVLLRVGARPGLLVLGAMAATAVISMWVNNTSTCIMMLPIGLSVVRLIERSHANDVAPSASADNFATSMVLGIAYAATIGGVGTLFGTAPNIILQSTLRNVAGTELSFAQYASIGIPLMTIYLPIAWLVLMWMYPARLPSADGSKAREFLLGQLDDIGPMRWPERSVLLVLLAAVALWTLMNPLNAAINNALTRGPSAPPVLSEASISIFAAITLFLIPARDHIGQRTRVLDWPTANGIQWGVLVLFGGGLSLAEAMGKAGVNEAIGGLFKNLEGVPPILVILGLVVATQFISEVASNTAVATTFLPIAFAGSQALGVHPFTFMFPVALAASYAFMMPMGTPPNAMAVATGRVRIGHMVRAGVVLNILAAVLITGVVWLATARLPLPEPPRQGP